ncbi:MAG TPA: SGNH/GDSL hydrolase family protein [Chitinophagaceae bacterium]|nr:SGNH/GDSL hydrolase family protein [Chitinophagaceae bacterium]
MLATQFAFVGGGEFKIPYMAEGSGGNDGQGNPRRVLGYVLPCNSNTPGLSPVWDPAGTTAFSNISAQGPFNLIGVPGARSIDATSGVYSLFNGFLQRFAKTPGTSSMMSEALRVNATFFSVWLGSNDVLLYSIGGAVPPANSFDPAVLTPPVMVESEITKIVDTLSRNGAKGVIANIPDITSIPFFTTIPWNSAVLTEAQAIQLDSIYAPLGITWNAGANGLMIVDTAAPAGMRHATADDMILLVTPSDSLKCGQWGVNPYKPLGDRYVLDRLEKAEVQNHIVAYNAIIAGIAAKYNLAFVDINKFMKTFLSGIIYNGVAMNANFVSGGAFSLDGVHPNQRGYALIANEFIRTINTHYGASVPEVDATKYKGIVFP